MYVFENQEVFKFDFADNFKVALPRWTVCFSLIPSWCAKWQKPQILVIVVSCISLKALIFFFVKSQHAKYSKTYMKYTVIPLKPNKKSQAVFCCFTRLNVPLLIIPVLSKNEKRMWVIKLNFLLRFWLPAIIETRLSLSFFVCCYCKSSAALFFDSSSILHLTKKSK